MTSIADWKLREAILAIKLGGEADEDLTAVLVLRGHIERAPALKLTVSGEAWLDAESGKVIARGSEFIRATPYSVNG
jgi:hypothetical protein